MRQARDLITDAPTISPETRCQEVYELFSQDPQLLAVAVLVDGRPVGLVNRNELTLRLADRYGRPLFEKRPISRLMVTEPLIVDADISIETLNAILVTERQGSILQGFIIVDDGRYLGMGTALSVLEANKLRAERRSDELDNARLAAESANRSKSLFLATMSHELRTPLNAIIGFSDFILQETLGKVSPDSYLDYIKDVNDSGRHLLNVINSILDLSKIEANRLELKEDRLDPVELAREAIRMMRATAGRKGISVLLEGNDGLHDLCADPQLMRQILLNLLSNAIKFSPQASVVTLRLGIDGNGICDDGSYCFTIIDQGIGIPEEELEFVMQPFRQADNSLSRTQEGSGLGLPLVKALAEAHGGRFKLVSAPGQGTSAQVILPADRVIAAGSSSAISNSIA